ncbi:hypothetical protein HDV03_004603 [Kappamyces sp. JEL0829]|nr:hypothetical protein HDV03_004603 [Kappamyces sp. JEL0829]
MNAGVIFKRFLSPLYTTSAAGIKSYSSLLTPVTGTALAFAGSTAQRELATLKRIPARQLCRTFRKHREVDGDKDLGRSVNVARKNVNKAYLDLKKVLDACNVRDTVYMQKRFESKPMRKRRKRREREWKAYLEGMKVQVKKAFDLKNRSAAQKQHYEQI